MSVDSSSADPVIDRIVAFLRSIGLPVSRGVIGHDTFLPGIEVRGGLVFDESKLKFPVTCFTRRAHLAVTPSNDRAGMSGEVKTLESFPEVIEMEAMLWSYAACLYLGLDPAVVFHSGGYHGYSQPLLLTYRLGVFPGVQGLAAEGMTLLTADADRLGCDPFPVMQKWLRD